jgi:AcrR family transcriptional regulator
MIMSISYERTGRVAQKGRTRQALIDAARNLLNGGVMPTVEQAAAAARVSRPTAYRYFPNQKALLAAARPELAVSSLLPLAPPSDVAERLELLSEALVHLVVQNELALRAMLRISLQEDAGSHGPLALRSGRRIAWVDDALSPLKERLGERYRPLVLSIASALGIEPFIWLVDVARLQRSEAAELMRASARALLKAATS